MNLDRSDLPWFRHTGSESGVGRRRGLRGNVARRLEAEGIHGNGHMIMIEKNNLEIAARLQKWITGNVK